MLNLTGLPPDKIQNWKRSDIHEHMGNSLLNLFNLLSRCNRNNALQEKFIKNILSTCCSLIGNITLDVFVTWAEVCISVYLYLLSKLKFKYSGKIGGTKSTRSNLNKSIPNNRRFQQVQTCFSNGQHVRNNGKKAKIIE